MAASGAGAAASGRVGTAASGQAGTADSGDGPSGPLSETEAERLIGAICFKTGPPGAVGAELEWLVTDRGDRSLPVPFDKIRRVLEPLERPGALPGAGLLTQEPGGQVELSTVPAPTLSACVAAAAADLAVLREAFIGAGLELSGSGLDPYRPPRRVLSLPRYAAMEAYLDRRSHWGRLMMCSTASVQVCVDAGLDVGSADGYAFRWRLMHALGPVVVAAFANSPLRRGRPTGWKCTRQVVWSRLDPGRTRAPSGAEPGRSLTAPAGSPRAEWVRYAMNAQVLCVRRPDGRPWSAPAGLTFRDWLRRPGRADLATAPDRPDAGDLAYHLSTLFPPVRPRGHLELRMIDAQRDDGWIVPVALVAALADDPVAADAAMAAAEPVWHDAAALPGGDRLAPADRRSPWLRAARLGLADPALAKAASECFTAACASLARSGASAQVTGAVADFADRYVSRGRCPADDLIEAGPDALAAGQRESPPAGRWPCQPTRRPARQPTHHD